MQLPDELLAHAPVPTITTEQVKTEWEHSLFVCCPESLNEQANQLAMAVGDSEFDGISFAGASHTSEDEIKRYSIFTFIAKDTLFRTIANPALARPTWDTRKLIDLNVAQQLRNQMKIISGKEELIGISILPDTLVLGVNISKETFIEHFKLKHIPSESLI
jgi:hypothetical protein